MWRDLFCQWYAVWHKQDGVDNLKSFGRHSALWAILCTHGTDKCLFSNVIQIRQLPGETETLRGAIIFRQARKWKPIDTCGTPITLRKYVTWSLYTIDGGVGNAADIRTIRRPVALMVDIVRAAYVTIVIWKQVHPGWVSEMYTWPPFLRPGDDTVVPLSISVTMIFD